MIVKYGNFPSHRIIIWKKRVNIFECAIEINTRHNGKEKYTILFSLCVILCQQLHVKWPSYVGISLEGMMLKLKLQYFGHLMRRVNSLERLWCWEGLGAGGKGGHRGWDGWMASLTWWMWVWVNSRSWWWTGRPAIHRVAKSRTRLSNWTELNWTELMLFYIPFFKCQVVPWMFIFLISRMLKLWLKTQ